MKPKVISEDTVEIKGTVFPCYTLQNGEKVIAEKIVWQLLNLMEKMGVNVELHFEEKEPVHEPTDISKLSQFDRQLVGLMRVPAPKK